MQAALIVDDSSVGRMILARMVTAAGWDVVQASGGAEALELLSRHQFDVVFLDLLMPDVDGMQVLCELRARGEHAPVVVLTADVQDATRVACERLGVRVVLTKPVTPEVVAQVLATLTGATA